VGAGGGGDCAHADGAVLPPAVRHLRGARARVRAGQSCSGGSGGGAGVAVAVPQRGAGAHGVCGGAGGGAGGVRAGERAGRVSADGGVVGDRHVRGRGAARGAAGGAGVGGGARGGGLDVVHAEGRLGGEVGGVDEGVLLEEAGLEGADALLLGVVVGADEVGVLGRVLPLAQADEDEGAGAHDVGVLVAAAVLGADVGDEGVLGGAGVEHAVAEHLVDAGVLLERVLGEAQLVGGGVAGHCVCGARRGRADQFWAFQNVTHFRDCHSFLDHVRFSVK